MPAKKSKKKGFKFDEKNKRLDLFLQDMAIEQDKRQKIVSYVETLTFNKLKEKSGPKLRLNK